LILQCAGTLGGDNIDSTMVQRITSQAGEDESSVDLRTFRRRGFATHFGACHDTSSSLKVAVRRRILNPYSFVAAAVCTSHDVRSPGCGD
jgi:hypothetical protein